MRTICFDAAWLWKGPLYFIGYILMVLVVRALVDWLFDLFGWDKEARLFKSQ